MCTLCHKDFSEAGSLKTHLAPHVPSGPPQGPSQPGIRQAMVRLDFKILFHVALLRHAELEKNEDLLSSRRVMDDVTKEP